MRTAIYARVSTKDGRQDTKNQLRDFATNQSWKVVREYVDRHSSKRSEREQFQRMFSAASRREFDCLLFWSLDRLCRERTIETLNHLQRLTSFGIDYRSFTKQYLDSTGIFKKAVISILILAAIAKQERIRLIERTIAGLHRSKAQGRIGGRPKAEDADPKLIAKVERLPAQGSSIRAIAVDVKRSPNTIVRLLKKGKSKNLRPKHSTRTKLTTSLRSIGTHNEGNSKSSAKRGTVPRQFRGQ